MKSEIKMVFMMKQQSAVFLGYMHFVMYPNQCKEL